MLFSGIWIAWGLGILGVPFVPRIAGGLMELGWFFLPPGLLAGVRRGS